MTTTFILIHIFLKLHMVNDFKIVTKMMTLDFVLQTKIFKMVTKVMTRLHHRSPAQPAERQPPHERYRRLSLAAADSSSRATG